MLNEGWRRQHRGTEVVVGLVETHGRPSTAAQIRDLEVIPPRKVEYRGVSLEEMDIDAILARHPEVALIDEMAHTNAPGSRNDKRWQDIEELLDAGIDVISTLNVQHLESLNDVIEKITGVIQRETIPDAIVRSAEQIELVDMTPEALRRRMAHGNIYRPDQVDAALANFFRVGNLAAIRELALLWMADRVEEGLSEYRERHGISSPWETKERVVIAMSGKAGGGDLVRRAARVANRARGELIGIFVRRGDATPHGSATELENQTKLLKELGGAYREVVADDIAKALVQTARAENATQLVVGSEKRSRLSELIRRSVLASIIRETRGEIDVHVISVSTAESPSGPRGDRAPRISRSALRIRVRWASLSPLPPRRVGTAFAVAAVSLPLLTFVLTRVRSQLGFATDLLLYLITVMLISLIGGVLPALAAAIAGFFLLNYFFTRPFHTFAISSMQDVSAVVAFVVVATIISMLVDLVSRRAGEAKRARVEASSLASIAGSLLRIDYPLEELANRLLAIFRLDGVSVLHRERSSPGEHPASRDYSWTPQATAGSRPPARPEDADIVLELSFDEVLACIGSRLSPEDREVIRAFAAQLALAMESRRVQTELADKILLEKANELRNALLAAVSHDLRTPLASIKTAATSLLAEDVQWAEESVRELLRTIDAETDNLNHLVGNLLDMSRLQSEALPVITTDVGPGNEIGLPDLVESAIAGCRTAQTEHLPVKVNVPIDLPTFSTDPALLERAIANLVSNALAFSPAGEVVQVVAATVAERLDIRVIDRGPGIPEAERENVFHPFHQLDGGRRGNGVGLGLVVARGFVDAVGGELTIEDTPGGGTTMVISIPIRADHPVSSL